MSSFIVKDGDTAITLTAAEKILIGEFRKMPQDACDELIRYVKITTKKQKPVPTLRLIPGGRHD